MEHHHSEIIFCVFAKNYTKKGATCLKCTLLTFKEELILRKQRCGGIFWFIFCMFAFFGKRLHFMTASFSEST